MKFFSSKSSTSSSKESKPLFRNLLNEFKMCSGSRSDKSSIDQSISYKSMSDPIDMPVSVVSRSSAFYNRMPLKSCMRKQSARSNLHTRFAAAAHSVAAAAAAAAPEPSSLFDTLLDMTPEKLRTHTNDDLCVGMRCGLHSRVLCSTAVDSPVIAFSNATYAGSPPESPAKSTVSSPPNFTVSRCILQATEDAVDATTVASPINLATASQMLCQSAEQFYTLRADSNVGEDANDDDDSYTSSSDSSSTCSSDSATFVEVRHRDIYMVCSVPYVARGEQELNLEFAERVQVLQLSPDWCLVRNLRTRQFGYVPAGSLMEIEQFLADLQFLTQKSN